MPNLKKVGVLSIAAFIVQLILTKWIYPIFGAQTQQLFSVNTYTGIGGQKLGTTLLGYLGGLVPVDLTGWIAMAIGTFAIIYAGFWIYESKIGKTINMDRGEYQRLFTILLYGHLVLYGVFLALGWGVPGIGMSLLLGLGINLLVVSVAIVGAAKYLKWPKV